MKEFSTGKRRGRGKTDYIRDLAVIKNGSQWLLVAIALALLILLPLLLKWGGGATWMVWINFTIITIIAVIGLNIITGMAGLISLGHSAFIMVGGYLLAIITINLGWSVWAALPVSAIVTGAISIVVAVPVIRLKGFYVAIVTLAFFFIAQFLFRSFEITGGMNGLIGIPYPTIFNIKINTDINWYYFLLPLLVLCAWISINITRSRFGRAFTAIRDNQITASSLGVNVPLTKLRAFFLGSVFAGLAGGLWASYISVVRLDQFTIWDSIWYLGMIIIGGAGHTAGAIMGVIFLRLISQILHVFNMSGLLPFSSSLTIYITFAIYGLAIILFISFQPFGLMSVWRKFKANYKRWPFGV